MISILDYGMGNLRSVEKAFQHLGEQTEIVTSLGGVERLVIPGVGAFGAAMERLSPLKSDIKSFASGGGPLLGICLGQQLLFERSQEHGEHAGLELLGGDVLYFSSDMGLKVPHIGWTGLKFESDEYRGHLKDQAEVYFVHSLYTKCSDPRDVAANANYGIDFAAAVRRRNIWGAQFHPEKSSSVGLSILRNWLAATQN
jgi:imidazole glycerol-phosphate synthase subunit HisH